MALRKKKQKLCIAAQLLYGDLKKLFFRVIGTYIFNCLLKQLLIKASLLRNAAAFQQPSCWYTLNKHNNSPTL